MAFIKLITTSLLKPEEEKTHIINTNFIIEIVNGKASPVIYYTSNGFEQETEVRIVKNYTFEELEELLAIKKPFDPLASPTLK